MGTGGGRRPMRRNRPDTGQMRPCGWRFTAMCFTAMHGRERAAGKRPKTWCRRPCWLRFRLATGSRASRRCGPGSYRSSGTRSSIITAAASQRSKLRRKMRQRALSRSCVDSSLQRASGATAGAVEDCRASPDGRRILERGRRLPGCPAPDARHAFVLRELDSVAMEELCTMLDLGAGNLRVRLHRARLLLRACLEKKWFGSRSDEGPTKP